MAWHLAKGTAEHRRLTGADEPLTKWHENESGLFGFRVYELSHGHTIKQIMNADTN